MKLIQKIKLLSLFLLLLLFLSCNKQKSEPPKPPNIILIMADDLGWGDTGYNGNKVIKTPHLDEMANQGIRFDRFYSASAVCSPTRCSVLTGRNPFRSGVFYANKGILRPEEITIAELLKDRGYHTGHFGKWHLGTLTHTERDANRGKPENLKEYNPPSLHGYDEAFVTESKVPTWDPMKKPIQKASSRGWDYIAEEAPYKQYGTFYWDINGNKVTDNLDGDDSRVIMDRVLPFVEKSVDNQKPFLAVVWFHTPHLPCVAGPEYAAMYSDQSKEMKNYAGCITAMDDQIGRLRKHLAHLGIDQNTMIWFCSDNGPENRTPGSTAGFRARKRSLYEGGVRVPGILVWPSKIKKGFTTNYPAVTSDYLPTITDILKIDKKKSPYQLDGVSLLPLIEGKTQTRVKPIGFCCKEQATLITNQHKLYIKKDRSELYNLKNDKYEKKPIENAKLTQKLRTDLEEFYESCKKSFSGKEYGTESYNKLEQKWPEILNQE